LKPESLASGEPDRLSPSTDAPGSYTSGPLGLVSERTPAAPRRLESEEVLPREESLEPARVPVADVEPPEPRLRTAWRIIWELLHDVSVAVLFCFFFVTFIGQAFRVEGTSMQPLLEHGERIIVNKLVYRYYKVERGDVVVFWYPLDPQISFIKRVVALPGDVVEIRNGTLFVNEKRVEEPYLHGTAYRDRSNVPPTEVKPGYYFVLGDHRGASHDSRKWGEVPEKYIYGKALFRFWPLGKAALVQ
jgi:signal peptidase I